jgi:hypothetical protein
MACTKKIFRQNLEEFKEACNRIDKLKEHKDEDSAEEIAALTMKLYLDTLRPTN